MPHSGCRPASARDPRYRPWTPQISKAIGANSEVGERGHTGGAGHTRQGRGSWRCRTRKLDDAQGAPSAWSHGEHFVGNTVGNGFRGRMYCRRPGMAGRGVWFSSSRAGWPKNRRLRRPAILTNVRLVLLHQRAISRFHGVRRRRKRADHEVEAAGIVIIVSRRRSATGLR